MEHRGTGCIPTGACQDVWRARSLSSGGLGKRISFEVRLIYEISVIVIFESGKKWEMVLLQKMSNSRNLYIGVNKKITDFEIFFKKRVDSYSQGIWKNSHQIRVVYENARNRGLREGIECRKKI